MALFRCQPCSYIYNEEKGDPTRGIKPGTKFTDLPLDWVCPVCGARQDRFEKIDQPTARPMEPIGLLMIEHRLIEKIVPVLVKEVAKIEQGLPVDGEFLIQAADFFHNYADLFHHGKEEDILFRELKAKEIKADERELLDQLVSEHQAARETVKAMAAAAAAGESSERSAEIIKALKFLIELYPRHIKSEDEIFFPESMGYFSAAEQGTMLEEMNEFDKKIALRNYHSVMKAWGKR